MRSAKHIVAVALAACAVALSCVACAQAPAPGLAVSPPVPSPARKEAEVLDELGDLDILEYLREDTYSRKEGQKWYEPVIENEELTLSLPDAYMSWLADAVADARVEGVSVEAGELRAPDWPMLAAILTNYQGEPEAMREALYVAGGIECSLEKKPDGSVAAVISSRPLDATELFSKLPESETTNAVSLLLSYAYLSTVFDDSIHGREGITPPDLDALMFPV